MNTRCRRIHRRPWHAFGLAAFACCVSLPRSARAEDPAPSDSSTVSLAELRAAEAFDAYTRQDYASAVALYLEAYKAAPSGSILYNIARIYDLKLADRPLAISYYRRYIADPGANIEQILVANQRLQALREAELAVKRAEPGDPEPASRTAQTGKPGKPARDPRVEAHNGWSTLRWTGVVAGSLGLLGIGGGAVFGLLATSKASTAKDACNGDACTSQSGVDAAKTASRDATVSNIAFSAGGALLISGAALFFIGADKSPRPGSGPALRWEPQVASNGLSLQLVGSW